MAYRSAPVFYRAGCQPGGLFFPEAVELRLRKISLSLLQDVVAAVQLTNLTLRFFQALAFSGGEATLTATGITLILMPSYTQGLRRTANFRGNGTECRPR